MKNFFKAFTMVVVAASLYSCGNPSEQNQAQTKEEEKVETTTTPEKPAEDSLNTGAAAQDSNKTAQ